MRRDCRPCLVEPDGALAPLERVRFTQKTIDENWLQDLLHRSPDVLPVSELDDSFAPLVPVGREVHFIDDLYVSPSGRITLVEAKLWRNPEATRQVVAQVLDYAKTLSSLSYDEFEAALRTAVPPAPLAQKSLYELVREAYPDETADEADFVDEVQRCLRDARFMMLVVGDGIRENVEGMIGLLHQQPQMLFTFGLVELQIYESPSLPGRLVVPQLVARTNEVVRAVVRVEGGGTATVSLDLNDDDVKSTGARRKLSEEEFFAAIGDKDVETLFGQLLSDLHGMGAASSLGTKSISVRLKDPHGSGQRFTLLLLNTDGMVEFGWLASQLERAGMDPAIAWGMLDSLAAMFEDVEVDRTNGCLTRWLGREEIQEKYAGFVGAIAAAVGKIDQPGQGE